jgi:hypothetical protein
MAGEVIVERHKRDYCPNAPADILAARQPANMLAAPQLSDSPATQQRSRKPLLRKKRPSRHKISPLTGVHAEMVAHLRYMAAQRDSMSD